MFLLFCICLISATNFVFCHDKVIYTYYDVRLVNTDKTTVMNCNKNNIYKFITSSRQLPVKNHFTFYNCYLTENFNITKLFDSLKIKVKRLTFDDSDFYIKNLHGLEDITHLSIKAFRGTLYSDILHQFPNLQVFHLEGHAFYYIPMNFFGYSDKLKTFDIAESSIKKLRKRDFNGLTNLSLLKLRVGRGMDPAELIIEDGAFENLTSLKSLDITLSILKKAPLELFKNLKNLETFRISCKDSTKMIISLPEKLFTNQKSLKTLNIEAIGSNQLPNNVFENLETLENLRISEYEGDALPREIFNNTRNIKVLQITNNNLEFLPSNIFKNLKKLEILDLSYNKFGTLPPM